MLRIFLLSSAVFVLFCQSVWSQEPGTGGAIDLMSLPDSALIFSQRDPVLSAQDNQALSLSTGAAEAARFPVQEADRTLHLYGGGRPTLICAPLKLCVVELQDGERVAQNGIHLGDTVRWKVTPTVGEGKKTFLVVKPTGSGLDTNLVIITDRHSYDVRLVSRPDARISKLAWSYPDESKQAWQEYFGGTDEAIAVGSKSDKGVKPAKPVIRAKAKPARTAEQQQATIPDTQTAMRPDRSGMLSELDFNYRISGCKTCRWRPVRVYNNGVQTVVELPDLRGKEAPALLVMGGKEERMVNYRILGNRYIVDQVFNEAVLLLGVGERQQRVEIHRVGVPATGRIEVSRPVLREQVASQSQPGRYYLQLMRAADRQLLNQNRARLQAMGYRAELRALEGRSQFVLQVGTWRDRAAADAALRLLREDYRDASLWEEG